MPIRSPSNKFLLLLGLPSFGLTFGVTVLTAFLPTELTKLTGPLFIGLIIGAEGIFGLFVPIVFGIWADRAKSVIGRFNYLVPATAAMAAALVLMGLIRSLWVIVPMVAIFYIGYFAYLAPYWAIYPDLIPKSQAGRSRSAEGLLRVTGAFLALIAGGFLLALWGPLPFIVSAGLITGVTFALFALVLKRSNRPIEQHNDETFADSLRYLWRFMLRNSNVRNLAIANTFWNATLQSIQAFVVIFFTRGLDRSTSFVSGLIFPVAAIGILIMAPLAGRLADKFGYVRTLFIAGLTYGFGDMVAGFTQRYWVIFIIPVVSAAATFVMIMPYATLMKLLGNDRHGAASGLFGLSRGLGSFLGPLLTGLAISLTPNIFKGTHGYAAFWLVAGGFTILGLPFLLRVKLPGEKFNPALVKKLTAHLPSDSVV